MTYFGLSGIEIDILSNARANVSRRASGAPVSCELIVSVARAQADAFAYKGALARIIKELEVEFMSELALAEDRGDTPCEPAISRTCDRCGEWLHTHDTQRYVCGHCLSTR